MTSIDALPTTEVAGWTYAADAVVVGQGIAGACAAIEAAEAGAEVVILERSGDGGGASAMSSGILYLGGGTAVQKACGYEDDIDNMTKFMVASIPGTDEGLVRLFCEQAPAHFDWLERHGVPFERSSFSGKAVFLQDATCLFFTGNEKAWPYPRIARPAPRGHKVAGFGEHAGAAMMAPLLTRCAELGITRLYDTRVDALVVDAVGSVVGIRARRPEGELFVQARSGVILATGMFTMNPEMVRRYVPLISDTALPLGVDTNDGNGLVLGQSVGARLDAMDGMIATASIYPPEKLIFGIIVNSEGRRIIAEDAYHGTQAAHIADQPDQRAFLVLDAESFGYPANGIAKHKMLGGWDTVAETAKAIGVPIDALAATLERYNADAARGDDTEFHKQQEWLRPLEPPYAVFDISFNRSRYLFTTLGGIKTNAHGQALDADDQPIRGLYAVGAAAAHLPRNGKQYASGMSLGPGSFFGRMAGRHAAAKLSTRL
jgi:3-oxo-5alpha-steroid 4-dehydrogenase